MKKFIKIVLIVGFFFFLIYDVFDFIEFEPELLQPPRNASGIFSNQIFAYKSTKFTGKFLVCTGWPILEYADRRSIQSTQKTAENIHIIYPNEPMVIGEVIKTGFKTTCNAGLIFLGEGVSFHLFDTESYSARYNIENRTLTEEQFEEEFTKLSPEFTKPAAQ